MRGSWMLDRVTPGKLLTGFAAVAGGLVLVSLSTTGALAGWSLIAVGPFNSIMFPTLFSLASEGQGSKTPQGAGPAVHGARRCNLHRDRAVYSNHLLRRH